MFSQSELFSQVFLKDIGRRCRKFITQDRNQLLAVQINSDQLLVAACDAFALKRAVIIFIRFQQFTLSCENVIMMVFNLAVYTCL